MLYRRLHQSDSANSSGLESIFIFILEGDLLHFKLAD